MRIDPQNKYFIIPNLDAHLVRIFYIDPITLLVIKGPSIPVVPSAGPRHGIFHTPSTYYRLLTEIASTLTSYTRSHLSSHAQLQLTATTNRTTYGPSQGNPFAYNAASEIALVPGGKRLIVSNCSTINFNTTGANPKNATLEPFGSYGYLRYRIEWDDEIWCFVACRGFFPAPV